MKKTFLLIFLIFIEVVVILYILGNFYFRGNHSRLSNRYYNDCILSPFTSEVIECIDRKKENVSPTYNCDFLIFNKNGTRISLRKSYSQLFDGCSYRLPNVTNITINSLGFRDYEYSLNRLNNSRIIAAIGSSITFGWGVGLNQSWPKQLEKLFRSNCSNDIIILNFGLPTANIIEKIEFFSNYEKILKPSLVLLEYNGYQDFLNYTLMNELRNNSTFVKEIMSDFKYTNNNEYNAELSKRIYSYEMKRSRSQIDKRFYTFFVNSVIRLHNMTESPVVVLFFIGDYYDIKLLKNVTEKYNWLYLIDLKSYLSRFDQRKLVLHSLDFHPSAYAYELASKYIYEKLVEYNLTNLFC